MFRVMVIKRKRITTVHIWDSDGRESVFNQQDIGQLIQMLKRARQSKGIPEEELDENFQFLPKTP